MTMSGAGYPMCRHSRKADCTWWCVYHRMVWLLLGIVAFLAVIVGLIALFDPAQAVTTLGRLSIAIPVFLVIVWIASMIFPSHESARSADWTQPDVEGPGRRRSRHR